MSEIVAPRAQAEFQYANPAHQSDTAKAGMWLFLATEVLFFGGLVFAWLVCHRLHPVGFHAAADKANLLIGSINSALLVTSSFVYAWGSEQIERGSNRRLLLACAGTLALGLGFIGLKFLEWKLDLDEHLFPGPGFDPSIPDNGGAQLFWCIYWLGTVLHIVHMFGGVSLVSWIGWRAHRGKFSAAERTAPEVVGFYWSFVDMVWLTLYPLIYVVGRV